MNKKIVFTAVALALVMIVYIGNAVSVDPGDIGSALTTFNNPSDVLAPGKLLNVVATVKNESRAYLTIESCTIEYRTKAEDLILGIPPTQWNISGLSGGMQDSTTILSNNCFKMPVYLTISNGSLIKKIRRIAYGNEIKDQCFVRNLNVIVRDMPNNPINAEVLIQIGDPNNKAITSDEYLYDVNAKLIWHKQNGVIQPN